MSKKGLILTMGLSSEPLIFSIQEVQADYVVFIGTDDSLKNSVDETVIRSKLLPSQYTKLEIVNSPDEIGALCEKFQFAKGWLERQGANEIISDPTGGRKWMSAGAVMAASFLGIPMIYVDVRHEKGKVLNNTMNLVKLGNAYDQTGFIVAAKGRDAYNNFDYEGAAEHFERISPTHAHKKELFQGLSALCRNLARWDRFEHYEDTISVGLEDAIQQINLALRSGAGTELFADFLDKLRSFAKYLKRIEATRELSIDFIVDLYLNAGRCIRRNRFDDATARYYRTLEAVSQYLLLEKGIKSEDPDYSKLLPEQIEFFKSVLRDKDILPKAIDLKQGFWLLKAINHPVKEEVFPNNGKYKNFLFELVLKDRNSSILAHGFTPIGLERSKKFHNGIKSLLEKTFNDRFKETERSLQLPAMPEIGF